MMRASATITREVEVTVRIEKGLSGRYVTLTVDGEPTVNLRSGETLTIKYTVNTDLSSGGR